MQYSVEVANVCIQLELVKKKTKALNIYYLKSN